MVMKKIPKFVNHWLMIGFVFVYSQALSVEFDIATTNANQRRFAANTLDPQNLPIDFNIEMHKKMCGLVEDTHKNAAKDRNVLMFHIPGSKRDDAGSYAFLVSGLTSKQVTGYANCPVIDAFDILEINLALTPKEKEQYEQLRVSYKTAKAKYERTRAKSDQGSAKDELNRCAQLLRGLFARKINEIKENILTYVRVVKNYFNDQDQLSIASMIDIIQAFKPSPDESLRNFSSSVIDYVNGVYKVKNMNKKPNDRICILADLLHTEILLRYAIETGKRIIINEKIIDFRDIANSPIINICTRNDMCYNCEHVLADFAGKNVRNKTYVSSTNIYPFLSRYAPYQFGGDTIIGNIVKVAFTDQDEAKSNPPSSVTSAALSAEPSTPPSAEPLSEADRSDE
ncbi:MAG: hypothetical protein LBJ13_03035 [Puniceicoccales bacterium]|jgi:hypothetical protein|nr:hypothetical protein [Puniceicoccales bacterium]